MRQYFARETKRGYAPLSLYTTAARTYPCKERNRAAFIHVYLQYVSVIRFEPVQKLTTKRIRKMKFGKISILPSTLFSPKSNNFFRQFSHKSHITTSYLLDDISANLQDTNNINLEIRNARINKPSLPNWPSPLERLVRARSKGWEGWNSSPTPSLSLFPRVLRAHKCART